jgi:hypothetical protein
MLSNPRNVLNVYTVYRQPKDYPDGYVIRRHKVDKEGSAPTSEAAFGATLEEVRTHLPWGLYRIDRDPSDDPCIVESWI